LIDVDGSDGFTQNFDKKLITGFKFSPNDQKSLKKPLQKTFAYLADQGLWERLINNGMAMGFRWDNSAH
tara:strand:+ start:76 stop:282 length:207 start_codon:yes stop_codon:yes gene_type:complete